MQTDILLRGLAFCSLLTEELTKAGAFRATKYLDENLVVRATRQMHGVKAGTGRKVSARDARAGFIITVGAPNYRERLFIKACRKAGEPFPVKKIQFQAVPVPRARKPRKVKPRAPR